MPIEFIMPKMDMDQEKVTIIEWYKQNGDHVEKGEPVISVETDKITSDIESPGTGTLAGILYGNNVEVPVTKVVAYILTEGETEADLPKASAEAAPKPAEAAAPAAVQESKPAGAMTPLASKLAADMQVDPSQIPVSGRKITREDVMAYAAQPQKAADGKVAATPAARAAAEQTGVDLAAVAGSGPRGRVQKADVLAYQPVPVAAQSAAAYAPAPAVGSIPFVGMRKRIAERLTQSYQEAPHIYLNADVDVSALEAMRARFNAVMKKEDGKSISMTAILVKIVSMVLKRHAMLNASLSETEITLLGNVNMGVATALDSGLIVPVIPNADLLPISEINVRMRDLAAKAREGKLVKEEIEGGSFTITNLGMFGVKDFTAIINPPQVAILAVGTVERRPVVVDEEDNLEVRPMMSLTLGCDHRVVDGAVGARFLADLKDCLTHPDMVLL